MPSQERDSIAAYLEGAVSAGASAEEVGAMVATTLRGLDQALAPIVGQRGMAALYKRSLHLSRPTCPWLPVVADAAEPGMDLAALSAVLAKQGAAQAAAAGTQLLESIRTLLNTLIGESLTERLLRPVWATLLSGSSARNPNS